MIFGIGCPHSLEMELDVHFKTFQKWMSDILDVTFQKWMSDISKMDVTFQKWMSYISRVKNGCHTFWMSHFENGCQTFQKMDVRQKWMSDKNGCQTFKNGCQTFKNGQKWMSDIHKWNHWLCKFSPLPFLCCTTFTLEVLREPIVNQLCDDVPTLKSHRVCLDSLRVVSPGEHRLQSLDNVTVYRFIAVYCNPHEPS